MVYIGIDDTDNHEQGGTGQVAREIADELAGEYPVLGVSRHQLLVDDRVPYTSNNSCNVIHVRAESEALTALADWVRRLLPSRCLVGSDPGLCVAGPAAAGHPFGRAAQIELVTQAQAREVASALEVFLEPLGGTGDGMIGALAGCVLAAGGNDGRFVAVGNSRQLDGRVNLEALRAAGIVSVETREGQVVGSGLVDTLGGRVRPLLRRHAPVLLVESDGGSNWRVVEQGKGGRKRKETEPCNR